MAPSVEHPDVIAYLRTPQAIRERCGQLFDLACADRLAHFRVDLAQLGPTADYVIQVMRSHYPDLNIPFHSRWRHFEVGDGSRLAWLDAQLAHLSPLEIAQAKFDLAVVSVLLDAGAGADWRYQEPDWEHAGERFSGKTYGRSEGLAIASFWMFCQGLFSSNPDQPFQVDAIALQQITAATLSQAFQASPTNPLIGLTGRTTLLQQLGHTLPHFPHLFGTAPARPGHLVNHLFTQTQLTHNNQLSATHVFTAILEGFSPIWPGRLTLPSSSSETTNLGDTWPHPALVSYPLPLTSYPLPLTSLLPFHKLSQWLTYSLLEPLQDLGLTITDLDQLTGLPEYRNGGLCLDLGLLKAKNPAILQQPHPVDSEVIVEWRALTVILLDRIAETIRHQLGTTAAELPLVKVLQGGTWTAGRQIAAELRPGGTPPIQITSDGTVF